MTPVDIQPQSSIEEMTRNLKADASSVPTDPNHLGRSPSDATSCISSTGDASSSSVKENEADHENLTATYSPTSYYGYYYPGTYGGMPVGESEEQGYYTVGDGLEIQYPVVQVDNGSLVYVLPGIQPGYNPYSQYLPLTAYGIDGQYVGQQPYSPGSVLQAPMFSPSYYSSTSPYGSEFIPPQYLWDPTYGGYGYGYSGAPYSPASMSVLPTPNNSNSQNPPSKSSKDLRNVPETKKPSSLDVRDHSQVSEGSQHGSTFPSDLSMHKGHYSISKNPSFHQRKSGFLYPISPVKTNIKGWSNVDKQKTRSKPSDISELGFLNEQNHGPRTSDNSNSPLQSGNDAGGTLNSDRNGSDDCVVPGIRREQYNVPDFPTKYEHALFFVIKSYSEDDVHKSIKYNVWASTPNGNKKLDNAFQEAQEKMGEKGVKCPIFLLFSVNASGQFCGVAEMIGRVNFSKNMDFWQQDKWNGFFPVKWHIIKDVPNPQLRHITLENNDNKPVTNCRDTQEVRYPQGTEMLNIFKNYITRTSILDDFDFYENRERVMQQRRTRTSVPHYDMLKNPDALISSFQSINLADSKKDDSVAAVLPKG